MTYDKNIVLKAATRTALEVEKERARLVAEWDARPLFTRFLFSMLAFGGRPTYYGERQREVAERLAFKATACIEPNVSLTDEEIDAIKEYWGQN